MSLRSYAESELDRIGMKDNDPTGDSLEYSMRTNILRIIDEFSAEGHSGSSASYAISIISKLLQFHPLTPLTGEDDEWNEIGAQMGMGNIYQNRRCSDVFKDDNGAYWSEGRVFWEWHTDPSVHDGEPFKVYFTSKDSRVPVEFPWTRQDKPEYVEKVDDGQV